MGGEYVFVYGSLKEGYWNNPCLDGAMQVHKNVVTFYKYFMTDCGFPYLIKPKDIYHEFVTKLKRAQGEVYLCQPDIMQRLDRLEGNGSHYQRELIYLEDCNYPVWAYFALNMDGTEYPEANSEEGVWNWKN